MTKTLPPIITRAEAREKGLNKYFTGQPCARGHIAEHYVTGPCMECNKENSQRNAKKKKKLAKEQLKEEPKEQMQPIQPTLPAPQPDEYQYVPNPKTFIFHVRILHDIKHYGLRLDLVFENMNDAWIETQGGLGYGQQVHHFYFQTTDEAQAFRTQAESYLMARGIPCITEVTPVCLTNSKHNRTYPNKDILTDVETHVYTTLKRSRQADYSAGNDVQQLIYNYLEQIELVQIANGIVTLTKQGRARIGAATKKGFATIIQPLYMTGKLAINGHVIRA